MGFAVAACSSSATNDLTAATSGQGSDALPVQKIMPAVQTMFLDHDWDQGCLYNQETAEQPQLYIDHMAKQGDAYQLAQEIRDGLDQLDVQ
ncbi:MAG TPA: hypothetical protein VLT45_11260 [Kofleriaceae bacterium]|nr:hypothetical protein [Kofleriaceae bacterium]